jgi:hypothetical protein
MSASSASASRIVRGRGTGRRVAPPMKTQSIDPVTAGRASPCRCRVNAKGRLERWTSWTASVHVPVSCNRRGR